jgi:hypothetical protein
VTSPNGSARAPVSYERAGTPGRPPVLLGCGAVLGAIVLLVAGGVCAAIFLESGADSGVVELEDADAYAPGSVDFVPEPNLFLVRDRSGDYHALDTLDAANRANPARRCRVQLLSGDHPEYDRLRTAFDAAFSPQGRALDFVFREDCNGATYDGTGLRLDAPGERNLDRLATSEARNGNLQVHTAERTCSRRDGADLFVPVECE